MKSTLPVRTVLSTAVATALAAWAMPALASTTMTAFGKIDLGGVSYFDNTPGISDSFYVDIIPYVNDFTNNGFIHTYGSSSGSFGSRSSGDGIYDVLSTFKIVETFTNTGAAFQGTFNFNIVPGQVATNQRTSFDSGEFVAAGMSMNIKLNGVDVWGTSAQVMTDGAGTSKSFAGTDIGYLEHDSMHSGWGEQTAGYYFNDYAGQLDLGTIAHDQTITVEYEIATHAWGDSTDHGGITLPSYIQHVPEQQVWVWDGGCYGDACYGNQVFAAAVYGGGVGGHWETIPAHDVLVPEQITYGGANGSIAQTGDPFDITGGCTDENCTQYFPNQYYPSSQYRSGSQLLLQAGIQPVPEPETWAMMLAGLGLLGWTMAKRRTQ